MKISPTQKKIRRLCLPPKARTLGHFPASPGPGGLAPGHPTFLLPAGSLSGVAPGGGGVGSRCRRRRGALLPSPGVPRPGRLCPMRSAVAGRWGVFLFWVEVEALERTVLETGSRRGSGRCGRWWSPHPTPRLAGLQRSLLRVGRAGLGLPPPPPPAPGTPGPALAPVFALRTPQRPARAAPAGPMRRDVNGVTKSRFEV